MIVTPTSLSNKIANYSGTFDFGVSFCKQSMFFFFFLSVSNIFNPYCSSSDTKCWYSLHSNGHLVSKWAPSSEFVSSSIPSWQISTAHVQPFRGARDLVFCLKVPLDSLLVWASSGGSGETARMRRLAWTFAARICNKYQIRLTRSKWSDFSGFRCMFSCAFWCHLAVTRIKPYKHNSNLVLTTSRLHRLCWGSDLI